MVFLEAFLLSVKIYVVVENESYRSTVLADLAYLILGVLQEGLLHVSRYNRRWKLGIECLVLKQHKESPEFIGIFSLQLVHSDRAELQPAEESANVGKPRLFELGSKTKGNIFFSFFNKSVFLAYIFYNTLVISLVCHAFTSFQQFCVF